MTWSAAVLLIAVLAPLAAADTVVFQDNYDSQPLGAGLGACAPTVGGPYNAYGGAGVIADASTQSVPGVGADGQFVYFAAANEAFLSLTSAGEAATAGKTVTFSFKAFVSSSSDDNLRFFGAETADPWYTGAARSFDVILKKDGTTNGGTTFATDSWISGAVVANYATKTMTATVDGQSWTSTFAASSGGSGGSLGLIYAAPGSLTAFDSMSVTVVPEPSTLLLASTSLLGLLAYVWRRRR
jgi:hypothetical protein